MSLDFLRSGTTEDFANQLFVPPEEPAKPPKKSKTTNQWIWVALGAIFLFFLIISYYLNKKIKTLEPKTDAPSNDNVSQELQDLKATLNHSMNSVKSQLANVSKLVSESETRNRNYLASDLMSVPIPGSDIPQYSLVSEPSLS